MAENAANFYTTTENRPSLFEIVAQKALNVTLQPALEKIAEFCAGCQPKYCWWLYKYYDETFLLLNGTLQSHYLGKHGATFSEYFYGLKRVRLDDHDLSKQQKYASWLCIVLLPYFKKKLDDRLAELRIQNAENRLRNDWSGKFSKLLIVTHTIGEIAIGLWTLIGYLEYMSNKRASQLPILQLLGLKLIYSDHDNDFLTFWSRLFSGKMSCSELSTGLAQNAVRSILEISAFFVQFLQAWNAEKSNFNIKHLPVVEPPALDVQAAHYKQRCPLCMQRWKSPMVLPVSGYVFCFACIHAHLIERAECPVTHQPAKPLDLIRIYHQFDSQSYYSMNTGGQDDKI